MRILAGLLAMVIGATGAVMSVLAIVYICSSATWLGQEVPNRLNDLEQSLDSLARQTRATTTNLDTVRKQVKVISDLIEELSKSEGDRAVTTSMQASLDKTVVMPLRNAEELVLSTQSIMRSMSSALLVLDSFPLFSLAKPRADTNDQRPLQSVATSLGETADTLGQVIQAISDIRTGKRLSPERLTDVLDALARVDAKIDGFQAETRELSRKVEGAQSSVAIARDNLSQWLAKAAVIATAFCVCFGCSQVSLLLHGRSLLARRVAPATDALS